MKENKHRILIVRPDRIGDVVLSTPIPEAIKLHFSESFVGVLVRSYTKDLFINNPFVDEIIVADEKFNFSQKVRELRDFSFTHALMLLPSERLNYLVFAAGIKTRIGVGHKFYQVITNTKSVFRRKYEQGRHEADYCFDTVRKLGVNKNYPDPKIYLSDSELNEVKSIRHKLLGEDKFLIGIHSTSGNSAPNWKPEIYYKLAESLNSEKGIRIAVTDNKIPEVFNNRDGLLFPNIGKSLREAILNFAALDLLVSASTGPMHIASALKVKTVSMFCPLPACSPKLWGPLGNQSDIILPSENYCQFECPGDPKKCSFSGKGGIGFQQVVGRVKKNMKL